MLDLLSELLADDGLFVRGAFHPEPCDGVPPLPNGYAPRTVVLVGNAGPAMWKVFVGKADPTARHPLEEWLKERINTAASRIGANTVLFPNDGPPYLPIQDWAARSEPVYRSPIGIMIHPEYGLWHVYRAILLFEDRLSLPPRTDRANPCDSCARKPCLAVCPADAFLPDSFDVRACVTHVETREGSNCRERGCLARRACPVGKEYRYIREQQKFHTAAMVRAARRSLE